MLSIFINKINVHTILHSYSHSTTWHSRRRPGGTYVTPPPSAVVVVGRGPRLRPRVRCRGLDEHLDERRRASSSSRPTTATPLRSRHRTGTAIARRRRRHRYPRPDDDDDRRNRRRRDGRRSSATACAPTSDEGRPSGRMRRLRGQAHRPRRAVGSRWRGRPSSSSSHPQSLSPSSV